MTAPPRVFHLTTPAGWAEARRGGRVVPPGFADEGFVHCSTLTQLAGTIERHFAGVDELVVLRLDPIAWAVTCGGRRAAPASATRTSTGRSRRTR